MIRSLDEPARAPEELVSRMALRTRVSCWPPRDSSDCACHRQGAWQTHQPSCWRPDRADGSAKELPNAAGVARSFVDEHRVVLEQSNGIEAFAGYIRLFSVQTRESIDAVVWNHPDCWKFALGRPMIRLLVFSRRLRGATSTPIHSTSCGRPTDRQHLAISWPNTMR